MFDGQNQLLQYLIRSCSSKVLDVNLAICGEKQKSRKSWRFSLEIHMQWDMDDSSSISTCSVAQPLSVSRSRDPQHGSADFHLG